MTPPRSRRTLPILLTLMTVLVLGLTGAYASTAILSDEVSLVALHAHGGTLDLDVVENGIAFNAATLNGILPGDSRSTTFTVTDTGSIPADLTFVAAEGAGTDPDSCFDYELRRADDSVLLTAGSLARRVALPLGSIEPGADGARSFRMIVTNRADCAVNGATGSLAATITAIQQENA